MSCLVTVHDGLSIPTLPYFHDPNDVEEYKISWGDELRTGEAISTLTWSVSPGGFYTIEDQNDTATSETVRGKTYTQVYSVWLSGGTAGSSGTITCRASITTPATDPVATRIKDKSFILKCKEM